MKGNGNNDCIKILKDGTISAGNGIYIYIMYSTISKRRWLSYYFFLMYIYLLWDRIDTKRHGNIYICMGSQFI